MTWYEPGSDSSLAAYYNSNSQQTEVVAWMKNAGMS